MPTVRLISRIAPGDHMFTMMEAQIHIAVITYQVYRHPVVEVHRYT